MLKATVLVILALFAATFAQRGHLPPDPGAAGKRTVLGIDSDGDGVRDDIQIEVTRLIPNDPYARAGAMFWFAIEQRIFTAYEENPNESFEFFYPYFLASSASARYAIITGAGNFISIDKRTMMLLNTRERFLVNNELDSIAHGRALRSHTFYPELREQLDREFQIFYEREKERQR